MTENTESTRRAAFYDRGFSVADMQFRPMSLATADFCRTFGIEYLIGENLHKLPGCKQCDDLPVGTPAPCGCNEKVFDATLIFAWSLYAPEDKVLDLCLDSEEATTAPKKKEVGRQLRREILKFRSLLPPEQLDVLIGKLEAIFNRVAGSAFTTAPKKDAPDSDPDEDPPGNS